MRVSHCSPAILAAALLSCVVRPAGSGAAARALSRDPEPITAELAAATFDTAWSTIHRTYYDSTFRGIDWIAVREKRRPQALESRWLGQLRSVITDMIQSIGESHFALIPGEAAEALESASPDGPVADPGDAGVELRIADNRVLVWRVDSVGPAHAAGVRTGWAVMSVDGVDVQSRLRTALSLAEPAAKRAALFRVTRFSGALFTGNQGESVHALFEDGNGRRRAVAITLRKAPGELATFGNLPPQVLIFAHSRLPAGPSCHGYITFNIWLTPVAPLFDRAMDQLRDCEGIILDLRGNPGGAGGMAMGIAGYFVDSVVPLGILRTRSSTLRFVTNPRRVTNAGRAVRPFSGPVAILVDEMSGSTSEIFAAGMKYIGRARVFGDTTARQALPALLKRLPTRDVLMHVYADYTAPDGTRLEGRGVIPDQVVPLHRANLLAGGDAPLAAAVQWIKTSLQVPR